MTQTQKLPVTSQGFTSLYGAKMAARRGFRRPQADPNRVTVGSIIVAQCNGLDGTTRYYPSRVTEIRSSGGISAEEIGIVVASCVDASHVRRLLRMGHVLSATDGGISLSWWASALTDADIKNLKRQTRNSTPDAPIGAPYWEQYADEDRRVVDCALGKWASAEAIMVSALHGGPTSIGRRSDEWVYDTNDGSLTWRQHQ